MHELNTKQILRVIRSFSPISRSEIVEKTNLTAATVSRIVNKLMNYNLVSEIGYGESSGGRKPVLLELKSQSLLTIGIDIEKDEILAVVIDINGQILIHTNRMLDGNTEKDYILNEVKQVIKELLSEEDYQNRIIGVGIGMHGLVDYARGISVFPPAFGWKDVPVADIIQKEFNLPVIIENNVRALTLAENWFGYARKLNNFICLKVGSGIGSSIFTDGKIYRGASNSAGEIGHTMVDEDGPLCSCGNYGCLESIASIPAMIRQAQKALKQGAESSIKELVNHEIDKIDEETIFFAAEQGDHLARRILHDAGRYLGVAIADLINILNPEAVIVSGKIVRAGDLILDSIRTIVRNRALSYSLQNVQIINSRMDKEGVAIGAAALILESVFNVDQNNSVDIGL